MENTIWNESNKPGIITSTKLYFNDLFVGAKRMSRADFWWGYLGTTIFFTVLLGLLALLETKLPVMDYYWSAVVGVAIAMSFAYYIIAIFTASIRRLHDVNLRAWWLLFYLIPGIGFIVWVVFMCLGQRNSSNRFDYNIESD
ncbi:DUF805 domain-containing protein [Companilactobacillus mishanensis]|uniref:DUF805 domain-containing protein n=1 Tax=Companilactobacillus mishanensis TaxID=2486008 RepID=UPI0012966F61|nr:DUF805 domain-containing protein [Companilactobacillus mishanensis]MQS89166.1 DUF805 domain-containing protein [Companilactobacillus mishanensis]